MVYRHIEDICGAEGKSFGHDGKKNGGFDFDHTQSVLAHENTRLLSNENIFYVAIVRDPVDRAIGMYNMFFNDKNVGSKEPMKMFTEEQLATIKAHWQNATDDQIRWRFSVFLDWLLTKPQLHGSMLVHFTAQARYTGVGCARNNTYLDLIGRVEKLPEVADEIARKVSLFRKKYEAFKARKILNNADSTNSSGIPGWTQTRMHDARGPWSMVPCLVDKALSSKVKAVFVDDYQCFGERVFPDHKW